MWVSHREPAHLVWKEPRYGLSISDCVREAARVGAITLLFLNNPKMEELSVP